MLSITFASWSTLRDTLNTAAPGQALEAQQHAPFAPQQHRACNRSPDLHVFWEVFGAIYLVLPVFSLGKCTKYIGIWEVFGAAQGGT